MEKWIDAEAVNKALDRIREEAWLHDIPSPTVPEYIEHHDAIQQIMLVIDKERKLLSDAADVAPVRHGMWREITESDCGGYGPVLAGYDDPVVGLFCSCCGDGYEKDVMGDVLWNYCPHCGAKNGGEV